MIGHIRHEPSFKQLQVKMNRTAFACGNRNRHHNTELNILKQNIQDEPHYLKWVRTQETRTTLEAGQKNVEQHGPHRKSSGELNNLCKM